MIELKPCPFCGGGVIIQPSDPFYPNNYYDVYCTTEGCIIHHGMGFAYPDEERKELVEAFNRRPPDNSIPLLWGHNYTTGSILGGIHITEYWKKTLMDLMFRKDCDVCLGAGIKVSPDGKKELLEVSILAKSINKKED